MGVFTPKREIAKKKELGASASSRETNRLEFIFDFTLFVLANHVHRAQSDIQQLIWSGLGVIENMAAKKKAKKKGGKKKK